MKPASILLAVTAAFGLAFSPAFAAEEETEAPAAMNEKCPVSGKDIDAEHTSTHDVHFCCEKCKAKFDKDPKSYMEKVAKAEEGKCPISGEDIDDEQTTTLTVAFCCEKCKAKFDKEPAKYLGKLK